MKKILPFLLLFVGLMASAKSNLYRIKVVDGNGKTISMKQFKNKTLLIVNTATRCGFTPQYTELQHLYEKYNQQGLVILDFPCNQFGQQAPGSNEEIHQFCTLNYNITFPQFSKIDVNGDEESPLFTFLKNALPFKGFGTTKQAQFMDQMLRKQDPDYDKKSSIKWNFTKFLIDSKGHPIRRFEPTESISDVEKAIQELLK